MEDVYKVIDDIHMKNIEHLDEKVNRVLQSDDHDALFMLGETFFIPENTLSASCI